MATAVVPPPLEPGQRVRIIAPSGPFDRTLVWRGIGWLAERYRVSFDRGIFAREGYLAGSDERRRSELRAALADPSIAAVVAARGGYGLTRIVHEVDWTALVRHPKWLVGFSDITAMHVEASAVSVVSLHAHNAAALGRGDALARDAWRAALEQPDAPRELRGEIWRGGAAEGPLVGGNLTVLFTCFAAGRLRLPRSAILILEDVTELPYRIDRMLTAMTVAGAFRELAGVVVGDMTDCPPGKHGVPADAVLRERLEPLGVPVLAGVPVGHDPRRNAPVHLGAVARLADGALRWSCG